MPELSTSTEPADDPAHGPGFDAVIVAGARSERLGGIDKAMVEVGGVPLLARAVAAVGAAARVVVVGPPRALHLDVVWCTEEPAGGGPVAGFAAGLALTSSEFVVLLAADLPFVAGAVGPLIASLAAGGAEVAVLMADGRANYLASAWRRNAALLCLAGGPVAGRSMRSLLVGLEVAEVRDSGGWSVDCDTWDAVESARQRASLS